MPALAIDDIEPPVGGDDLLDRASHRVGIGDVELDVRAGARQVDRDRRHARARQARAQRAAQTPHDRR